MRNPEILDWRVPRGEWERFREYVEDENGSLDGYLGREAEAAMREYAESDGYEEVEDQVDRLVRAAGRRPKDYGREKKFDAITSQPTTRVTVRVDEDVKNDFRAAADNKDHSYGVEFAQAIWKYTNGGRAGRLEEKLSRIVDDAEALLSEASDSTDDEQKLGKKDRNVIQICNNLNEQFTDAELERQIHDVAGRNSRASDPTVREYRELVLDRLDVSPHPFAEETVWIPTEDVRDHVPEGVPGECWKPLDDLDHDDRVWRIIYAAGRRAAKRQSGKVTVREPTVRSDVFNDEIERDQTLTLMEEAAFYDGVTIERNGEEAALKINLYRIAESGPTDFQTIIDYRDAGADPLLGELTDSTVSDFTGEQPSGPSGPDSRLDELTDATAPASSDGGVDNSEE